MQNLQKIKTLTKILTDKSTIYNQTVKEGMMDQNIALLS